MRVAEGNCRFTLLLDRLDRLLAAVAGLIHRPHPKSRAHIEVVIVDRGADRCLDFALLAGLLANLAT